MKRLLLSVAVLLSSVLLVPAMASAQTITRTAHLTWNASSTPAPPLLGYVVERATGNSGGPYTRLTPTPQLALMFDDSTLAAATTYWYRLRAVCPASGSVCIGESDPTASAQAVVPADPAKPGTPGNVQVTVTVEVTINQ